MAIDPTPIRRCICAEKSFEELKASGLQSFEELQRAYGVSNGCGLCEPYVREMLESGTTAFPAEFIDDGDVF